jgi:hypothetical protein
MKLRLFLYDYSGDRIDKILLHLQARGAFARTATRVAASDAGLAGFELVRKDRLSRF